MADGAAAATDEETSAMSITGELVTETLEYDGGREVTVYVPPEPPEAPDRTAVRSGQKSFP
jgi:hypothetical protein